MVTSTARSPATGQPTGRDRLVRLIQRIEFGRIDHLAVRHGQPVFDPPPAITRDVKLGPREEQSSTASRVGNPLKLQFTDLFRELDKISDGVIERIEIKHSLPFRVLIPETFA